MKFGKVDHPEKVDFRFPPVPKESLELLKALPQKIGNSLLYLGATGWSMREWHGTVYPKSCKPTEYLKYYSQQFNTIEFNTTHYRIPTPSMVKKWYDGAAKDFKFCPKLPQTISHRNDLGISSGQLDFFIDSIIGFEDKLGCCFMQLPPYFGPNRREQLKTFMDQWPSDGMQLCIEFRHPGWFNSTEGMIIFDDMRKKKIGAVITDVSGRRDVLHLQVTADFTMIRFVGNGLITSDIKRLNQWVTLLEGWESLGIQEVYFFPHQPDNVLAPEATVKFSQFLDPNVFQFRYPNLSLHQEGEQMDLF